MQELSVIIYKNYASFCCVYLRVAPVLEVQDIILNPPNLYLRITIQYLLIEKILALGYVPFLWLEANPL